MGEEAEHMRKKKWYFFFFCSFENAYEGRVWVNRVVELAGFDLG
jgi:hypothetical protein